MEDDEDYFGPEWKTCKTSAAFERWIVVDGIKPRPDHKIT